MTVIDPADDAVEFLAPVPQTAEVTRQAEHQQQVADDAARNRGLDDFGAAGPKRHDCDDQFRGIAERGVEESAERRTRPPRQVFRRRSNQSRRGDEGNGGEHEHPDRDARLPAEYN